MVEPPNDSDSGPERNGPESHRKLLRRVDGYLEGMDRLLSSMESDIAGGGLGPHHEWDGRSQSSRARLLAERLEHIAHEMETDERFLPEEDNDNYDSPFR